MDYRFIIWEKDDDGCKTIHNILQIARDELFLKNGNFTSVIRKAIYYALQEGREITIEPVCR